ncbi:MAG: hypothetical protein B6244_01470 [Candidatus Cloacimonetes bacterium 4572_55]|nr:MAG: hypothetical protein B6244_01470 [Candidatus Cloacimonetes bacterium 4572_55]
MNFERVVFYDYRTTGNFHDVRIDSSDGEYFLASYHARDHWLETSSYPSNGLLVWHVNENPDVNGNIDNRDEQKKWIDIECAEGLWDSTACVSPGDPPYIAVANPVTGGDKLDFYWRWPQIPDWNDDHCASYGDAANTFKSGDSFSMVTNPSSDFHKLNPQNRKLIEQDVHSGIAILNMEIAPDGMSMSTDIYRNWYGGPLRSDLTLQDSVIIGHTLTVPAGLTLTVADSAVVTMWPLAGIVVQDGGQLIVGNAQIIATDANNSLRVYGTLNADQATFTADERITWDGITIDQDTEGNGPGQATFSGCIIERAQQIAVYRGGRLTVEANSQIIQCPEGIISQKYAHLKVYDSMIQDGNSAIQIWDGDYDIQGNTIQGCAVGIDINWSHSTPHRIIDNSISDARIGIQVYSSIVQIGGPQEGQGNLIENNRNGLVVLHKSKTKVMNNVFRNNNDAEEIQFDHSCFVDMDGYINQIIDDDYNPGTPDEILIACIDHPSNWNPTKHKVRKNYWGENYGEQRFSPDTAGNGQYDSFEIEPIWDDPPISTPRELYLQADEAAASGNYDAAIGLYQQVVADYFSSEEARASIGQFYFIEKVTDKDFPTLRSYLESLQGNDPDEAMIKTISHFINLCLVSETNFVPPLAFYNEIIANPPGLVDSIFAVIDAGVVYLKMSEEDSTASPQSSTGICPTDFADFLNSRNRFLSRIGFDLPFSETEEPNPTTDISVAYGLDQNYPNPFNPSATISFGLARDEQVTIEIYNVLGQKVQTLVHAELSAGYHQAEWNGTNHSARPVSSGVYYYRMKTESGFEQTRRMILMK